MPKKTTASTIASASGRRLPGEYISGAWQCAHELRPRAALLSLPALFLTVFFLACSGGQETGPPTRYTLEQFLDTVSIRGGSFSPDEETVLFSSDASGVYNAHAVPSSGGEAQPLTDSTDTTYTISYFPEDSRALLRRDSGGNEIYHIYLREEDGTIKDLTPGENNRSLFFDWAHDDRSFFYECNARDPKFMDLYEFDLATMQSRIIYRNDGYKLAAISNDKRRIALEKERTDHDSDIHVYDVATGEHTLVTPHEGDVRNLAEAFTADSKGLYYRTDRDHEFLYLARRDLDGGAVEVVEKAGWDVMSMELSRGGKYMALAINNDARIEMRLYETAGKKPVALPEMPDGDIGNVKFSRSERRIVFHHRGAKTPADLYVFDLAGGALTRLTENQNPAIDPADLVEIEVVRYPSFDGLEIPALLMKPRLAPGEKAPAIVQVHGGPGGQTRSGYSGLYQYLVNHGYVVLHVNNRGSSGYGKTFYRLDDHKHGQDDLMDCVKAKDYLISTGFVDENRIGIMGGSYGGYMVLAALTFQPEVFDVGVNIFGVANWVRTLKSIPPWWTAGREALFTELGNPETEEEYLREISPLFHTEKIQRPLIVLQGANDPRVLKIESDEIVAAAKKNGVPVEYVVFDDEGHGFSKKANRIRGYQAIKSFLDLHLKGAAN